MARTLDSLVCQTISANEFEVIVIDNASTDSTRDLVQEWTSRFSNIRYELEPNLGLNRARNRGWREAKGIWVAYTDDDAIAHSNWLQAWQTLLTQSQSRVAFAGGKIVADWDNFGPSWLPSQYKSVYTILDLGGSTRLLDAHETVFGANMVFCRQVLQDFGGFDDGIGAVGDGNQSYIGDEADLITRLLKANQPAYYFPDAVVTHMIVPSRLKRSWFLKRMYVIGKSQVALDKKRGGQSLFTWRRVLFDSRVVLIAILKMILSIGHEQEMFRWLAVASQRLGRAVEEMRGILAERAS